MKTTINLLSIKSCNDEQIMQYVNYCNVLSNIKRILDVWKQRDLVLFDRMLLIKSLAIARVTHYWSTILDPNQKFFKELEKLLYTFLRNSGVDQIKRSTMIAPSDVNSPCTASKS